MVAIREHFEREGPGRESEWARQRRWFIKAKHEHQRREDITDKVEDNATAVGMAVAVVATPVQVREFETALDSYDTAVIQALMENEQLREAIAQQLARVNLDILQLLRQAHVLEDGRRVFKSEDGSFVIDEFGEKVSPEEVDFDSVTGPTAETYLERMAERDDLTQQQSALNEEHQQLLRTQEQIDAAREQIADGDITVDELEALDAELLEIMPDTARAHAGLEPSVSEETKVVEAKPTIQTQNSEASTPAPTPNL